MISIKTKEEVEIMREGGRLLALILSEAKEYTKAEMTTKEVDKYVGRLCLKHNVVPAFKGYLDFPANICISLNNEVVHGLPSDRKINNGDIVSLDFGVLYKGFNTDAAITFGMGEIDEVKKKLIVVAEKSFHKGIKVIREGVHLGDVSHEIQKYIEDSGFSVIRCLAGHGIGKNIHESPTIPNFGKKGTGPVLKKGMVLAIEPMVAEKGFELEIAPDGWTYRTVDGGLTSHFEHDVVVTQKGWEILTTKS